MRFIEQKSAGPILLLIPGFPNNHRIWHHQKLAFAGRAHLIFCDLGIDSFDEIVKRAAFQLQQVILQNPERKIFIVGHDLGCFVATEVSKVVPHLVEGQILLNGVSVEQFAQRVGCLDQWLKSIYIWLLYTPLVRLMKRPSVQRWLIKRTYDQAGVARESSLRSALMNSWQHVGLYRNLTGEVWSRILGISKREPSKTPTLLIHGTRDPFLVAPCAKELQASYELVDLRILQLGHWAPFTDFQVVNDMIETFCFTTGDAA